MKILQIIKDFFFNRKLKSIIKTEKDGSWIPVLSKDYEDFNRFIAVIKNKFAQEKQNSSNVFIFDDKKVSFLYVRTENDFWVKSSKKYFVTDKFNNKKLLKKFKSFLKNGY